MVMLPPFGPITPCELCVSFVGQTSICDTVLSVATSKRGGAEPGAVAWVSGPPHAQTPSVAMATAAMRSGMDRVDLTWISLRRTASSDAADFRIPEPVPTLPGG